MGDAFRGIAVNSTGLGGPAIAIAAARAGGIGVLDVEPGLDPAAARAMIDQLLSGTDGEVGLRIAADNIPYLSDLIDLFSGRLHCLIVHAETGAALSGAVDRMSANRRRRLLVEITDIDQLAGLDIAGVDGFVARGHETGGWVGEDSTLILLQKLLSAVTLPVYAQGGIGMHGAAACRAAGAAGVVLDDQLLLMPESPLPADWKQQLAVCKGQETRAVGERLGVICRVLARPGLAGAARLQELADRSEAADSGAAQWRRQAAALVGWGPPEAFAWPVGQAVQLAAEFRDRYKTTGRLIQAMVSSSARSLALAARHKALAPDAPLAASHGTRYPIVQGPMTRVSDSARFADAVSRAGALPLLALALMPGDQTLKLLSDTKALVGDRSWGVGLLGFVPKDLRDKQVEAIWQVKPPFALIAGGRPDQAADFERRGIAAYIHVPTAELLRQFLDQGARRFVFEGRECGGHIGPLCSLMLWETQINLLLEKVARNDASQVHVLFAGGIHDARSAAMLAAMAAPLAERGMRIGVLMGSAYLFTQEIVETGAIVPEFQAQALACRRTVNLETGPGHSTRCAVSPFAQEFHDERRRMMRAGESGDAIRERLEDLNLGRLRLASKGKIRDGDRGIVDVDVDMQVREGMYMIGQVATLRHARTTLAELHRDVSEGATALLDRQDVSRVAAAPARPADIAIVGIGTLLPKAPSPGAYWHNIVHKVNGISEVPSERWDWRLYYDPERRKRDKIYSKWGGFLDEIAFDPTRYGIPPNSLRSIDPLQLLALEVVRRALEDAGYDDGDFDRENTSVIFGASGGLGDLGVQYAARSEMPRVIAQPDDASWDRLPEWTEESFSGLLLNVAAGRVANRFDFGGLNFAVDAACASGLAAINLAVSELESGRSNLAIAGGIDTVQSPFGFLCFSKTQALSPEGKAKTFDADSDGIVISEGLAVLVLKRLADAERDGDRIYAVIKSVAGSSDGKALGLTAPLPAGQMRALDRAYAKAGFSPNTLGLVEAHGTGTAVGDRAEIETVVRTLAAADTPARSCAVGSVKTILGHTKATAGAAGLIKVALSLHHRTLPPHVGVTRPLDPIAAADSPVYLLDEARPWFAHPDHPRRAGVSAFGFGGTNFHAVVEEYRGEYRAAAARLSGAEWPCELFVFRATDKAALAQQLQTLRAALKAGAAPRLRDLAYSLARRAELQTETTVVATIVAADLDQLGDELDRLSNALGGERVALPPYVQLGLEPDYRGAPVAFVFPGQGTQYPNMAREAALHLEPLRAALEHADRRLRDQFPQLLTQYIYPPAAFSDADKAAIQERLTDTRVAQPAIGAVAAGFLDFVSELGLRPAMTAGHSYGEFAALHAGGMLSRNDFLALSGARGRVMAEACNAPERGTMAAVRAERDKVEACLKDVADVIIANHNSPQQAVISGPEAAVKAAVARLKEQGLDARQLPVAGAFHSRLMAPVQAALTRAIDAATIQAGTARVYSNTTGEPYPDELAAARRQLTDHLLRPVEFVRQIERMYADGARVFVELGPKSVLSGLVGQILGARKHLAVALDGGGGLRGVLSAIAALVANGVQVDLTRLFDRREVQQLNLARLAELHGPERLPPNAWLVSGGCARPQNEPMRKTGKLIALNLESAEAARLRPALPAAVPPPPKANGTANGTSASVPAPTSPPSNGATAVPPMSAPAVAPSSVAVEALLAYQETMRQFIALQEQVMTRFLSEAAPSDPSDVAGTTAAATEYAVPIMPPTPAIAAAPVKSVAPHDNGRAELAAAVPPSANGATLGRQELQSRLLEQVSERTGYPPEMLGLDQDIEAELGIDSIKRVEILGALQERLPAAIVERVKAQMETLTRVKTLNGLLDRLLEGAPAAAASAMRPVVVAPPSAGAANRDELRALLLNQVSERTGYPPEMLGLDQDIEAELGIDSIKRVEVLGALQERLPAAIVERVKAQMETLTRVKTLNGILDGLLAESSGASAASPVALVPAAASRGPDRPALTALLVQQVSERTGYPPEMLGLDQDIEAELGIDSIKRVEILGALQERLPEAVVARVKEQMETLTRVKTLNGIVDRLMASTEIQPDAAPIKGQVPIVVAPPEPTVIESVPRFRINAFVEPLAEGKPPSLAGLFLITEDELSVAPLLAKALAACGARPEVIARATMVDSAALGERVSALTAEHGPVNGIIHLAPLSRRSMPHDLPSWRTATAVDVKALYDLLRACAADLIGAATKGQGWLLAATAMGGSYGRDGRGTGVPTAGGVLALLKSVRMEWAGLAARNVDVDPATAPAEIAARLLAEFGLPEGTVEIGVVDGRRTAFRTVAASYDRTASADLAPASDWVVLVTGGARGITAEIAGELARPGMRIVVVGRTSLPAAESPETAALADAAALRKHFLARTGGQAMTPAAIDRAVQKLMAEREIRRNLTRLAAAGAQIDYRDVDVRDESAFGGLFDDVYAKYGRLDAVIHGAGIIEDKLIVHKAPDSFARVFDTKADSTFILGRRLRPDSLKLLVLFTSVSGRYGNRGQSDYAAANETMNRLAWHLQGRWPAARVVAINWGPWDSSGMVTAEVRRKFRERAVTPIEATLGRQFFADEIRFGKRGDVEVVAGAGPWHAEATLAPSVQVKAVDAKPAAALVNGHGSILIAPPTMLGDGSVSVEHSFDVATHPFLNDHRLDNIPVLPAAAAMEWMAQLVQSGWPDWVVHELNDVRVLKGFRLDGNGAKPAMFRARASSHADAGSLKVAATFADPQSNTLYYKTTATLLPRMAVPLPGDVGLLSSGEPIDTRRAYQEYLFHGPCFQLLTTIDRLGAGGGDASVVPSEPRRWLNGQLERPGADKFNWLFDPGLLDAAFQLALVWARVRQNTTALPGHLGLIARYGEGAIAGPLQLRMRITPRTTDFRVVFDATFIDRDGKVRLTMQNMECPSSRALNRLGGTA